MSAGDPQPEPRAARAARFGVTVCCVAAGAALFAVVFRSSLALLYRTAYHAPNVVEAIAALPSWLRVVVPTAGGLVAGLISRLKRARGQNVSNVMEAVALGNVRLSIRTTALRVAASWAAIATGMSIGREGPLIEFGGSLGASFGRIARCSREQIRVLVAAGTAAGFASAYNTPFAAVLFVVETVVGIAAPVAVLPAIAATVIASAITRALVGGGPIYGQRSFALESPLDWIVLAAVAVLAAIAAHVFKRALLACENLFERRLWGQPWRAAIGGLIVGFVALVMPMVAGNGFEPLNLILDGRLMAVTLIALLGAKWLTTSASVASGVPGGVFTPALLTGGIVGALIAHLVSAAWPALANPAGSLALVGMAAAIAASIRAPLTAAVLVFELSGDYAIVLPLLFVTLIASGLTRAIGGESIYESELTRRGLGWELTLEGRRTRTGGV